MTRKITNTYKDQAQTATDVTIAAGNDKIVGTEDFNEQSSAVTFTFQINTILGSSEARLQVFIGDDVNGNPVWQTVATSTNATDYFVWNDPIEKVRLKIVETGGTSGLEGINVYKYTRTLA